MRELIENLSENQLKSQLKSFKKELSEMLKKSQADFKRLSDDMTYASIQAAAELAYAKEKWKNDGNDPDDFEDSDPAAFIEAPFGFLDLITMLIDASDKIEIALDDVIDDLNDRHLNRIK